MATSRQLRAYLTVQRRTDARITLDLERAARDAERHLLLLGRQLDGPGARTRSAQVRRTISELRAGQRQLWREGVLPAVVDGRTQVVEVGQDLDDELRRVLYSRLPEDDASIVERGLNETAREGMRQYLARSPVALSARVYRAEALARRQVEARVRSALARGLAPREFAAEVRRYISPDTRGGVSYAAMRLARTELARVNHERQIQNGKRPGVLAYRWNLSGSHKVPDECNDLHGSEWKRPEDVPDLPHPQCLCWLDYVMQTPAEFARSFERGDLDSELERRLAARREARAANV